MKNVNWKIGNAALWVEVILSYLLPFKVVDNFSFKVGFPMPFITVYDTELGINPLMSMSLNPFALLLNGVVIYLIISACIKVYYKLKGN